MEHSALEVKADTIRPWYPNRSFQVESLDRSCWYPRPEQVTRLLNETWLEKYAYLVDLFDCDDYAWILRAFVLQETYRILQAKGFQREEIFPWAFGWVIGTFKDLNGYHAMNFVLTTEGFRFVEPQNDQLRLPDPVADRPVLAVV